MTAQLSLSQIRYCAAEVARQEAGPMEVHGMAAALSYAIQWSAVRATLTEDDLMIMAFYIESHRQKNVVKADGMNYRHINVQRKDRPLECIGAEWTNIPHVMGVLLKHGPVEEPDVWTKALLDIHPWLDGNGRTASLARNWLLGTLAAPTTMPDYYADEEAT